MNEEGLLEHTHCISEPISLTHKDHWTLHGVMADFLPKVKCDVRNDVLVYHIVTDEGTFGILFHRMCGRAVQHIDESTIAGKKEMLRTWVDCTTVGGAIIVY